MCLYMDVIFVVYINVLSHIFNVYLHVCGHIPHIDVYFGVYFGYTSGYTSGRGVHMAAGLFFDIGKFK